MLLAIKPKTYTFLDEYITTSGGHLPPYRLEPYRLGNNNCWICRILFGINHPNNGNDSDSSLRPFQLRLK